jgi:hypothetical protein
MFPLTPDILLLVKYFIFITCICFWVKMAYEAMKRSSHLHSRHHRYEEDDDADDEV